MQPGATPGALPPWHMWGSSIVVRLEQGGSRGTEVQLVRVNYKRPETWSFFFGARILDGSIIAGASSVFIDYEVVLGVGRTLFTAIGAILPGVGFCSFAWQIGAGANPAQTNPKWTTRVFTPPLNDFAAATTIQSLDEIPAQDIQIKANVSAPLGAADFRVVELCAWVAPRAHLRPDWFERNYLGSELGGT
jgi:hypothetical protein